MLQVGEGVDYRGPRVSGQFLQGGVGIHPRDDALGPSVQIPGHILDRLPDPHTDRFVVHVHGISTQLMDANLKGGKGSEGGLFEYQGYGSVLEKVLIPDAHPVFPLEFITQLQNLLGFFGRKVQNGKIIPLHGGNFKRQRKSCSSDEDGEILARCDKWIERVQGRIRPHEGHYSP